MTESLYEARTFDVFWHRYLAFHAEPFVARVHAIATASAAWDDSRRSSPARSKRDGWES